MSSKVYIDVDFDYAFKTMNRVYVSPTKPYENDINNKRVMSIFGAVDTYHKWWWCSCNLSILGEHLCAL